MSSLQEALQRRRDKESGLLWASDVSLLGDGSLFLGSGQDASNLSQLRSHEVTHVMNVADDVPNFHSDEGIVYSNLNVGDFGADSGISRVFDSAIQFAQACREQNHKLLVHCANGSNRSSTIVVALLVALDGLDLKDAFLHLKRIHRATNPLKDNRRELMSWEKQLRSLSQSTMRDEDFDVRFA